MSEGIKTTQGQSPESQEEGALGSPPYKDSEGSLRGPMEGQEWGGAESRGLLKEARIFPRNDNLPESLEVAQES